MEALRAELGSTVAMEVLGEEEVGAELAKFRKYSGLGNRFEGFVR